MVHLDQLKDSQSREWYLRASIEHGWSHNVLKHRISSQLRERVLCYFVIELENDAFKPEWSEPSAGDVCRQRLKN